MYKRCQSVQTSQNTTSLSTTIIMKALSVDQTNQILSLLDLQQSTRQIAAATGPGIATISKVRSKACPDLKKSSGGCPSLLTGTDM